MKDKKIKKEPKPISNIFEKMGMEIADSMKKKRQDMVKGNRVAVQRMLTVIFNLDEKGECDNVCEGEKRQTVKAGDDICSVGMVRRGRNWGRYGGVFCCECPYFIPKKTIRYGKEERQ